MHANVCLHMHSDHITLHIGRVSREGCLCVRSALAGNHAM